MNNSINSSQTTNNASSVESKNIQSSEPNVTWQHIWSLNETRDALSDSSFIAIPNEILLRIFRYLSVRDLCNVSLICRSFKMVADHDDIWKLKCNTSTKLYSKSFKQIYMKWIHEKSSRNIHLRDISDSFMHRTACVKGPLPYYRPRYSNKHTFESIGGFENHPNASVHKMIKLSVDISKTTPELLTLLEKASKFRKQWQESSILKQMITRYYRFMQLKAYHPANILLIPTIDIEIVWQTHLLRPEIYQADCRHLFRRVIDHSLLINDIQQHIKEQAFQDTCQLYEQRFGEQYCPLTSIDEKKEAKSNVSHDSSGTFCCIGENYSYWDNTYYKFPLKIPKDYENPFSFTDADIIIDMNWLDFCKQFMANPKCNSRFFNHNLDQRHKLRFGHDAMKKLEKSYERFLYMAAKYPLEDGNVFVSPTYAIDIIWHSHMQEPLKYVADCIRLVGYVINHSPWPQIDDHTMKKSCDKTNDIWKEEFDSDITTDHV